MRAFLLCLLLLQQNALTTKQPTASAPPIHIDVQLVQMVANVRDRHTHAPITGLGPKDFSVTQDGHTCPVRYVRTQNDLPLTIAILYDTSLSELGMLGSFKMATERFLTQTLGPNDRVFFVTFGSKIRVAADLSAAGPGLDKTIESITATSGTEVNPRKVAFYNKGGTRLWDALDYTEKKMAPIEGRKAIMAFTDGGDNLSDVPRKQVVADALSANTIVYGLYYHTFGDIVMQAPSLGTGFLDLRFPHLVQQTGGMSLNATKGSLDDRLRQIADALRTEYVVEFEPPDAPAGVSASAQPVFHAVEVRVLRPNADIRTRRGYYR